MAELNFPNPADSPTYEQAGIVWTWSETLEAWISDGNDGFTETDGDGRYLRKDATAGAQTVETTNKTTFSGPVDFSGQSTHTAGVSVTGPDTDIADMSVTTGLVHQVVDIGSTLTIMKDMPSGVQLDLSTDVNNQVGIYSGAGATGFVGLRLQNSFNGSESEVQAIRIGSKIGKTVSNYYGVYVDQISQLDGFNVTGSSSAFYVRGSFADHASGGSKYCFASPSGNLPALIKGGIQFDTTGSAIGTGTPSSLILDDYEEGTWIPSIRAIGGAGTTQPVCTYTSATVGSYTKIGDTVHVWFRLEIDTLTDPGNGALCIQNLPFSATIWPGQSDSDKGVGSVNVFTYSGFTFTNTNYPDVYGGRIRQANIMMIGTLDSNGDVVNLNCTKLTANSKLMASSTYKVS